MRVLIVEDNAGDAFMIEEMLNELKMELRIMVVEDGVEAMTLLQNKENIVPDLVILDLNLPGMDGFEILELMKGSDEMRKIPVIVQTGSLRSEDEIRARSMGAIDYYIKPSTFEEIQRIADRLKGHLILTQSRRKDDGKGQQTHANMYAWMVYAGSRPTPSLTNGPFVLDVPKDRYLESMEVVR